MRCIFVVMSQFISNQPGGTTYHRDTKPAFWALLKAGSLSPVWQETRRVLDRYGSFYRGRINITECDSDTVDRLELLVRHQTNNTVPLETVEKALVDIGAGGDLNESLTQLGFPPEHDGEFDDEPDVLLYKALRIETASWPEAWADRWADNVVFDHPDASPVEGVQAARHTRRLLDYMNNNGPVSMSEMSAVLFGHPFLLGRTNTLTKFVQCALQHRIGVYTVGRKELWSLAGIKDSTVEGPVLTWGVPATGATPLGESIQAANRANIPFHLTRFALERSQLDVPPGTRVLVVQSSRVVEAAAERRLPACVVATESHWSEALRYLLSHLRRSRAEVQFHTDFTIVGFGLGRRLHKAGCEPWNMNRGDYLSHINTAKTNGIPLVVPDDPQPSMPLPWDPTLHSVYNHYKTTIYQESLLDDLLGTFAYEANYRKRGRWGARCD